MQVQNTLPDPSLEPLAKQVESARDATRAS